MAFTIVIDGRYLNDHYPGIARYLFNMVSFLPVISKGEHFCLFYHQTSKQNSSYDLNLLQDRGIRLIPTNLPIRSLKEQLFMGREVRRTGADVFHTPFYLTAVGNSCPTVVTLYDTIGLRTPEFLSSALTRLIFPIAMGRAVRRASMILTLSEISRNDLIHYFPHSSDRIRVTPGAAGPTFFPVEEKEVRKLYRRLNIAAPYVLYVGTHKPHKNLERLIRAWALVIRQIETRWKLVIAGQCDSRCLKMAELVHEIGVGDSVLFIGRVEERDLAALYSGAGLFVFPSILEGFGFPILEAMACKTAVACSNTSSLPEVAGRAAVYFDPLDVRSISEVIARLLNSSDLRQHISKQGLDRAGHFSWENTARLTLSAYHQAADRSKAS